MADDRRKRGGRGRGKQVAASSGKPRGVKPTAPAPATATQGRDGTGSQSESDSSEDGVDLQASQQTGDGPAASADEESDDGVVDGDEAEGGAADSGDEVGSQDQNEEEDGESGSGAETEEDVAPRFKVGQWVLAKVWATRSGFKLPVRIKKVGLGLGVVDPGSDSIHLSAPSRPSIARCPGPVVCL